jgi:hypothetical protein
MFQFQSIAQTLSAAHRRRVLGSSGESVALVDER